MVVKHLKTVAVKHKVLIAVFLMTRIIWVFMENFVPFYFQTVIDNFTNNTLTGTIIAIYGTALISLYIISYVIDYPAMKLDRTIEQSLKIAALRKVSIVDYFAYTKLGTGALIQRIENGASSGRFILYEFYLRLAGELLPGMIISLVFVFTINRTIVVIIILSYIIVFLVSNLLLKILYKVKERILVNEEKFNHFLVRGFMEMVTFRMNRRFAREIQKTEDASKEIVSSAANIRMAHEAFFTAFAVLVGIVKISIIIYGWTTASLTIGQIVALFVLLDNAYQPIAIFNVDYVAYKLEKIAFARYTKFLDAKEDIQLLQGDCISLLEGDILFSEVDFNYGERKIFDNFSLHIEKGKTTAFVGESGSGKSTAIKLLVGLLKPSSGSITVDGLNLQQINLNNYYEHIAYLPQEASIFDGTVRENLVFDDPIEDTTLIKTLEKVGLPGLALDTQLGERGIRRRTPAASPCPFVVF